MRARVVGEWLEKEGRRLDVVYSTLLFLLSCLEGSRLALVMK